MAPMQTELTPIADRVRGVASENRANQERIAAILGISRQAANQRLNGRVPFLAHEISRLAEAFHEPVSRFFPLTSPVSASPEAAETGDPHDARRPVPDRAAGVSPVRRAS